MISRPTAPRWAFWTLALALLLKAAVPLLASASAHVQGRALVEICTGYGVATVALDDAGSGAPPPPATAPHADQCTLSSLLALAAPPAPATLPSAAPATRDAIAPSQAPPGCDACARWVAGLKHGPPSLA